MRSEPSRAFIAKRDALKLSVETSRRMMDGIMIAAAIDTVMSALRLLMHCCQKQIGRLAAAD